MTVGISQYRTWHGVCIQLTQRHSYSKHLPPVLGCTLQAGHGCCRPCLLYQEVQKTTPCQQLLLVKATF